MTAKESSVVEGIAETDEDVASLAQERIDHLEGEARDIRKDIDRLRSEEKPLDRDTEARINRVAYELFVETTE